MWYHDQKAEFTRLFCSICTSTYHAKTATKSPKKTSLLLCHKATAKRGMLCFETYTY